MAKETAAVRTSRVKKIINVLKREYPHARTALEFQTPLQLLISTILSAQCTDVRVNMVTPALFARFRNAIDFADADQVELEGYIRSTGFYHNKAKNIIACSRDIVAKHAGAVPGTMEELVKLAGVGRKTANCVLGGAFGINSGVVVDTHVERLSARLGLSNGNSPEAIEMDLVGLVPQKAWYDFSNWLILHGRGVCIARKPNCPECKLSHLCPAAESMTRKFWPSAKSVKPRKK